MSSNLAIALPQREDSLTSQPNFGPTNFDSLLKWAERVSKSQMIPTQYRGKPDDIVVAVMYGAEVGLSPIQSLISIAVINGRPALYGDGFLAVIMSHPQFEGIQEDDLVKIEQTNQATCRLKRRGMPERVVTFTMEMAKLAKLADKEGPWKQYPSRQLQMRARGFCGRDLFADVLRGVKIAEELMDYPPTVDGTFAEAPAGITAPVHALPTEIFITKDEARECGKTYQKSGRTLAEARAFLQETFGVDSSLKIPAGRYPHAMEWARHGPNAAPKVAADATPSAATPEAKPAQTEETSMSPDEKNAREAFAILGWDLTQQAKAIEEHRSDWTALMRSLSQKLDA